MKHLICLSLISSCLLHAEPAPPSSAEKKPSQESLQSYMRIDPQARATDYQTAFEQLRKEKTAGKVYFQLNDGTMITNIIEMHLLPNSTMILFRYNSQQGIKLQTVKVEEIVSLHYQP